MARTDHNGKSYILVDKVCTFVKGGQVDFGFRDKQNRAVGYSWRINAVKATPLPDDAKSGYCHYDDLPLDHFEVVAFPTRNGRHYGASGHDPDTATFAEAEAIVRKRIEQARKRDTKKFVSLLIKGEQASDFA